MTPARDPRTCGCWASALCPACFAAVEQQNAERSLRDWLATFGAQPDARAARRQRQPPRLPRLGRRLVPRESA